MARFDQFSRARWSTGAFSFFFDLDLSALEGKTRRLLPLALLPLLLLLV